MIVSVDNMDQRSDSKAASLHPERPENECWSLIQPCISNPFHIWNSKQASERTERGEAECSIPHPLAHFVSVTSSAARTDMPWADRRP